MFSQSQQTPRVVPAPSNSATEKQSRPPPARTLPVRNTLFSAKTACALWYEAFQHILPYYVAVHLAFFVTTYFSSLFLLKDFSSQSLHLSTLWQLWARKDAGHFRFIALYGYTDWWRTAFFPLYPLLERSLLSVLHNPYVAGLFISNSAGLLMLVVLYRLVNEDFGHEQAMRTVLYLSIFPTAFFLAAAYNESLFILLSLLSFYCMRRGLWWRAGLFGCLASLTRSAGLLLLLPFVYEYLRQHQFRLRMIRFDSLSGLLIAAGTALFSVFCSIRFHDALAFSHAQTVIWSRQLRFPGEGMLLALQAIKTIGLLSFLALHNLLDLGADLFILALLLLSLLGPWRMSRTLLSYSLYGFVNYLFFQLFPVINPFPLTSIPRFMLELFPAFIVLAALGKHTIIHVNYIMISCALLFLLLTLFLTGHWFT